MQAKGLLEDTEVIIAALTQNKKAEIFIPIEFREKEEVKAAFASE